MPEIGIIAIGRNEGERLRRCLASVVGRGRPVVYVDSASTDGSPAMAREMGAEVVDLDMSVPFSAARARNEGVARLLTIAPGVQFVQMVDGDCEVVEGWVDRARQELEANPEAAVVCGRRRERFPDASVYNRLADVEWNTPVGEAKSCGGDAMFRVSAFQEAGGYDNSVVAGEEPELCQRLREKGWKVFRVDAEMTIHDSAMLRFRQWWKRAVRSGYGATDVATRFRRGDDGLFVRQVESARFWTVILLGLLLVPAAVAPFSTAVVYGLSGPALAGGLQKAAFRAAAGVGLYAVLLLLQGVRVGLKAKGRVGGSTKIAIAYGLLTMIGKWANYKGQRQYLRDRKAGRLTRMIDYKSAGAAGRALPAGETAA